MRTYRTIVLCLDSAGECMIAEFRHILDISVFVKGNTHVLKKVIRILLQPFIAKAISFSIWWKQRMHDVDRACLVQKS
jgi:hypothetical protein